MSTDKADTENLTSLKSQRSTMKRNITQMKAKVDKDGASTDYIILDCRLQILKSYFKQISYIQSQIEKLEPADTTRSDLEEIFITAKSTLINLIYEKKAMLENIVF